jgi:hypothetical protein
VETKPSASFGTTSFGPASFNIAYVREVLMRVAARAEKGSNPAPGPAAQPAVAVRRGAAAGGRCREDVVVAKITLQTRIKHVVRLP